MGRKGRQERKNAERSDIINSMDDNGDGDDDESQQLSFRKWRQIQNWRQLESDEEALICEDHEQELLLSDINYPNFDENVQTEEQKEVGGQVKNSGGSTIGGRKRKGKKSKLTDFEISTKDSLEN